MRLILMHFSVCLLMHDWLYVGGRVPACRHDALNADVGDRHGQARAVHGEVGG